MRITLAIAALMLSTSVACAADEHTITSIDNNGVVTLDDGNQYQADDADMVQQWANGETVLVPDSDDKLINTSRSNEETDADPQ